MHYHGPFDYILTPALGVMDSNLADAMKACSLAANFGAIVGRHSRCQCKLLRGDSVVAGNKYC